jgi:hypothetical protein
MKVRLCVRKGYCEVIREPGDPAFSGDKNAAGESRLLYHLKQVLNKRGLDLIKKRMSKDGHLVDDMQQYLRTRSPRSAKPHIFIFYEAWAIRGADEDFRKEGRVTFRVFRDIFN